jgi:hypothetical protein
VVHADGALLCSRWGNIAELLFKACQCRKRVRVKARVCCYEKTEHAKSGGSLTNLLMVFDAGFQTREQRMQLLLRIDWWSMIAMLSSGPGSWMTSRTTLRSIQTPGCLTRYAPYGRAVGSGFNPLSGHTRLVPVIFHFCVFPGSNLDACNKHKVVAGNDD